MKSEKHTLKYYIPILDVDFFPWVQMDVLTLDTP